MTLKYIGLTISICLFGFLNITSAQTEPEVIDNDTIQKITVDEVQVVKAFEATLKAARHTEVKPILPSLTRTEKEYNYNISIAKLDIEYPDPIIKPLAMKSDPPFPVNKGFAKVGYGNLKNPLVMLGYHESVEDSHDFSVLADYYSADNSNDNPFMKMSKLNMGLSGNVMVSDDIQFKLNINANNQKRYFFHESLRDSIREESDLLRNINNVNVLLGIKNVLDNASNVKYELLAGFNYSKITNNDANGLGLSLQLNSSKRFSKNIAFHLNAKGRFDKQNADFDSDLFTLHVTPYLQHTTSRTNINIGADFINDKNVSKPFPYVDIAIGIIGNNIQLIAGSFMTPYTYNLGNLSQQNPWINANIDSLSNNIRSEIYAGLKGEFAFISYEAKVGYRKNENQKYLNNQFDDISYFNQIGDELETKFVNGNIDFAFTDDISIGGKLALNIYDSENYDKAIHLPVSELGVSSTIRLLSDKLLIEPSFHFADAAYYLAENGDLIKLNRKAELNFEASYRITNNFSVWTQGINLLDKDYQRWYGYDNFGIHFAGGLSLIF